MGLACATDGVAPWPNFVFYYEPMYRKTKVVVSSLKFVSLLFCPPNVSHVFPFLNPAQFVVDHKP